MRRWIFPVALLLALSAQEPSVSAPPGEEVVPRGVLDAMQSVVGVEVSEVTRIPVFRGGRFRRERVEGFGAGSGVVVSGDGLIITNAHVVTGSAQITVRLFSGREVAARVVSLDPASDLALLRVEGERLRPLIPAETIPSPGSPAFVIGNRGDRGIKVGWAKIGSHHHVRVGARPLEFWSEIEAYVGPGDSGGAVVDVRGRLVGIPSLQILYTSAERSGSLTAGLFIPIDHVLRSLRRMRAGPRATWPWIGLVLDDPLIAVSEGRFFRKGSGPRIRSIVSGGPADGVGLRRGDRIVTLGGRATPDNFAALGAVLNLVPDRPVEVEVERDGTTRIFTLRAGRRPPDPRPDALDDFTLHTGLRLTARPRGEDGAVLSFAGMTPEARGAMPEFEADLFARGAILDAILPGQDVLAGRSKRVSIRSLDELAALMQRCFVKEQFVALAHWSDRGGNSLDRAHVHRKIYPLIL
ncbi:MAG: S1C family serine protease [Acidobacteria bacterium]|nr:S1C family serine protease [Acidobacteriota bacterium]